MSQLDSFKSFDITAIEKILSALASEDSIKICLAAKKGISKSTQTIKELGLTQRRYYTHLNELIKTGLIERSDDIYQLTMLGTISYNLGEVFNTALSNRSHLDLADKLRKVDSISLEDTKQIMLTIMSNGILGSPDIGDFIHPVKMIENYESLVSEIISRIDKAIKNIYSASYYTDPRGIDAILRAFERGVDLSFLSNAKKNTTEKLQLLRMILNPDMMKFYSTFFNGEIKIRSTDFPFSFYVIDEKYVILELPNPLTNSFYTGFSFENESFGKNLIEIFEALYKEGKEHPLLSQRSLPHE